MKLLALTSIATLATAAPREIIPFDFGWRHYLGVPNPNSSAVCDASTFATNLSALECFGLTPMPLVTAPPDCIAAACVVGAPVWQFSYSGKEALCFVGTPNSCSSSTPSWMGGRRNALPFDPAPAATAFNDTAWDVTDVPFDATIGTPYERSAPNGEASIPKQVTWWRKHFVLPTDWAGAHVSVYFEGVFALGSVWLNGVSLLNHSHGYTSFAVRLDNATGAVWGGRNVLAVYADPTQNLEWFYQGSAIYRPTYIVRTARVRVQDDSLFAKAYVSGDYHGRATPAEGLTADAAVVLASADVEWLPAAQGAAGGVAAAAEVAASFLLYASDGVTLVASSEGVQGNISAEGSVHLSPPPFTISTPELWSIPRPYLYTLVVAVSNRSTGEVLDATNLTIGLRSVRWDGERGLFLNEQRVKLRGFCEHSTFTAVGMAVPARINLFRMQQLRGMGANGWRCAHNACEPATLALADRLGVTVMDENRLGAAAVSALIGGARALAPSPLNGADADGVTNFGDMVRRDRFHAANIWFSSCNEGACSPASEPTLSFKVEMERLDGSRALTGNMFYAQTQSSGNATAILDVQGFSHESLQHFEAFHAQYPDKPVAATECCGCQSQRGEDNDLPRNASVVYHTSWTQNVTQSPQFQTYFPEYVAGLFIWAGHDYYGEGNGWPHVSSSHGQVDLAGFPKAPAFFFRSWWLANVSVDDAGRPPAVVPTVLHIVESWTPPPPGVANRTVHVYSNAPFVALLVNGAPFGAGPFAVPQYGWGVWNVTFVPGNLTCVALASDGATVLATASRFTYGAAAALRLSVDAPSPDTGTGRALYLDGSDVGLLRAEVVDTAGAVVGDSSANVTFSVVDGPGVVLGCGNGDPANLQPNREPWRSAYHGVVRAVVRGALDAATPDSVRSRRLVIDVDAGGGPLCSSILPVGAHPPASITVRASSPGLPDAEVTLPLSVRFEDSVLGVALAGVGVVAALQ